MSSNFIDNPSNVNVSENTSNEDSRLNVEDSQLEVEGRRLEVEDSQLDGEASQPNVEGSLLDGEGSLLVVADSQPDDENNHFDDEDNQFDDDEIIDCDSPASAIDFDIEIIDLDDDTEPGADVRSETIEEVDRGEKFTGQCNGDTAVWWSKPAVNEESRTWALKIKRLNSSPKCTKILASKPDALKQLLSSEMIRYIVIATNRKANRTYAKYQRSSSHPKAITGWRETNEQEMYAFIAILIYAGAENDSLSRPRDMFHRSHLPFYRAVMSMHRFEQLRTLLRFDDSTRRQASLRVDSLAPFRHIWTLFQTNLNSPVYVPSSELKIAEQLISCSKFQSKSGEHSIRIIWMVDAQTNYPLSGGILLRSLSDDEWTDDFSQRMVLSLADRFLDAGANITMGQSFTSYRLAKALSARNTTLVGPIRSNQREIPELFASSVEAEKREPRTSIFCFSDEVSLVSYKNPAKENILLMSTAHATDAQTDGETPDVINDYNEINAEADTLESILRNYTCARKSNSWSMALFYNLIDISGLAAYRLFDRSSRTYSKLDTYKYKRFLKELAIELAQPHLALRCQNPLTKNIRYAMKLIGYKTEQSQVQCK